MENSLYFGCQDKKRDVSLKEIAYAKVEDHMNKSPVTISELQTIADLVGVFKETDSYEVLISGKETFGLVTVRDLLDTDHLERTKVENVTRIVGSVKPDNLVIDAVDLMMRHSVRAVPVVEEGNVFGLLSQVDVVDAIYDSPDLRETSAREIMVSPVKIINFDGKVATARKLMLNNRFSHLPVIGKDGRLKGIITAKDIIFTFIQPQKSVEVGERIGETIRTWDAPVKTLMDEHPLTTTESEPLFNIVQGFRNRKKSACIVTHDDKPVGIITLREIMSLLLRFSEHKGPSIYILGLDQEDLIFDVESARQKVLNVIDSNLPIHPDIEEVFVHVEKARKQGVRTLYEVRARVWSATERIHVKAEGWDLPSVFDELSYRLDRKLREAKRDKSDSSLRKKGWDPRRPKPPPSPF